MEVIILKILIGADIVPTSSNYHCFSQDNAVKLVGKSLLDLLKNTDIVICNLETPITDCVQPIDKCGPNHECPTSTIEGIKALNIKICTLANNHIMDQGVKGLLDTETILKNNGIAYVGAGSTENEASGAFTFSSGGTLYGIYACAEHEFSIVDDHMAGANPFSIRSLRHIAELKNECHYVIVLYHGGKEFYRYPSPELQDRCHAMIESGADLVICQHSHCIGCEENYLGAKIVYGQGNFIFDDEDNEYESTGLLVGITEEEKIEYIPIQKKQSGIVLCNSYEKSRILADFMSRSVEIKNSDFVKQSYEKFAKERIDNYLLTFRGVNTKLWFRVINKLTNHKFQKYYIRASYTSRNLLAIQNYIECEAHRELLIRGIKDTIKNGR